jgi:hypothetical protein
VARGGLHCIALYNIVLGCDKQQIEIRRTKDTASFFAEYLNNGCETHRYMMHCFTLLNKDVIMCDVILL